MTDDIEQDDERRRPIPPFSSCDWTGGFTDRLNPCIRCGRATLLFGLRARDENGPRLEYHALCPNGCGYDGTPTLTVDRPRARFGVNADVAAAELAWNERNPKDEAPSEQTGRTWYSRLLFTLMPCPQCNGEYPLGWQEKDSPALDSPCSCITRIGCPRHPFFSEVMGLRSNDTNASTRLNRRIKTLIEYRDGIGWCDECGTPAVSVEDSGLWSVSCKHVTTLCPADKPVDAALREWRDGYGEFASRERRRRLDVQRNTRILDYVTRFKEDVR